MGFNRKDAIMMQDGEKKRQGQGHRDYVMAELKQDYLTPRVIIIIEVAKVSFRRFFRPLALFLIANYDHIRLF